MKCFVPPFCANPLCRHHFCDGDRPYTEFIAWGCYRSMAFGKVPRFRCSVCGKTFSAQTFSPDYYAKLVFDYESIAQRLSSCESLSAIGRALNASTDTISNRISRASRQVLAFESALSSSRMPDEDLAADGFESFCVSQYFPNNITIMVGSTSQFVYAVDYATLRRKGRMTPAQKARRAALELRFNPDPRHIEKSFARVADESLRILSDGSRPALRLWTDEHQAYPRALRGSHLLAVMQDAGRVEHHTISSRAARTRNNPLFPVNYLDRELRKDLKEHVRETVCFGREVNRQMERLTVYLWWHNYMKLHRSRGAVQSHAAVAGYDLKRISEEMKTIWKRRAWFSLTDLTESMRDSWIVARRTPLGLGANYLPRYALA